MLYIVGLNQQMAPAYGMKMETWCFLRIICPLAGVFNLWGLL